MLGEALRKTLPRDVVLSQAFNERISSPTLTTPPSPDFGDLTSSLCLEVARRLNIAPDKLAERVAANVNLSNALLIKAVRAAGGYVNFYANDSELSQLALESARFYAASYGYLKIDAPLRVIVEHTSVNPAGPVHVGTARNSVLGDSLCRLLRARGHNVTAHFYVDDVGRQVAVLAYGYDLLNRPKPKGKADHWVGLVYAITSCIIEIEKLKQRLKELEGDDALHEEANKARLELDDWVSAASDLREKDAALFEALVEGIDKDGHPEESIAVIMGLYERNDPSVRKLIREVVGLCLTGFRETYDRVGIRWDSWDWESDLVWSSSVSSVLDRLQRSPYLTTKEGAFALDVDAVANELNLKRRFGISEEHEIPPLVLARSDGTTLYSTRDIAYSLLKLNQADKVINVIGSEQALAQLQIRIALCVLASVEKAEHLVHYAYELVKTPGYRMSKRRGRYVMFDEILDEAVERAFAEVDKRSPHLSAGVKRKISEAVGMGAVKYALVDLAPSKQVVFTWDKVLNFEMNSAPFIQYAYARAANILEKAEEKPLNPDYALLREPLETSLVRKIAFFPETFASAADALVPSQLTEFAYDLAANFNSFYASLPVLKAEPMGLRDARLALVEGVRITLKNVLNLLGIETLERM